MGGLYEKVRLKYAPQKSTVKGKDFFDANFFLHPDSRPLFLQFIAELKESCRTAKPTATHHFLRQAATDGRLARWYTQNIDCLEEQLGLNCWTAARSSGPPSTVVTLHGTLSQVACTQCKTTTHFTDEHLDLFRAGREPACHVCRDAAATREALGRRRLRSGFLRPDIVLYNEPHPHGDVIADFVSADLNRQPNLLLVMGTSLKISGLKKMIKDFARMMKSRVGGENTMIVYVNKTAASRAEWQGVFDFELVGECDQWIETLQQEYARIKKDPKATRTPSSIPLSVPSSGSRMDGREGSEAAIAARRKTTTVVGIAESVASPPSIHTPVAIPAVGGLVRARREALLSPTAPSVRTRRETSVPSVPSASPVRTLSASSRVLPHSPEIGSSPNKRINDYFPAVKSSLLSSAVHSTTAKVALVKKKPSAGSGAVTGRKHVAKGASLEEEKTAEEERHEHVTMGHLVI